MKYYDITPVISEKLAVFPGDVGFQRKVSMDFAKGNHLQLSSFQTTFHLGAHADSNGHYHANGGGVEQRKLSDYFGRCQVISVEVPRGARIYPKDVRTEIQAKRILFRTGSFPDFNNWNSDFNSLSPELVEFLFQHQVQMIGIDTPSVDPETSKALESHQALHKTGISVLEGLDLADVPDAVYQLVALPLPFQGADASPVRAILIQNPSQFPDEDLTV